MPRGSHDDSGAPEDQLPEREAGSASLPHLDRPYALFDVDDLVMQGRERRLLFHAREPDRLEEGSIVGERKAATSDCAAEERVAHARERVELPQVGLDGPGDAVLAPASPRERRVDEEQPARRLEPR